MAELLILELKIDTDRDLQQQNFNSDEEMDETYEAVLKGEFDRMRKAFEKRISELQQEMKYQRVEYTVCLLGNG